MGAAGLLTNGLLAPGETAWSHGSEVCMGAPNVEASGS